MARILLVEDDEEWVYLIRESLPQHMVETAESYDGAMEALRQGVVYDVAIVDLNLVKPPDQGTAERFGDTILDMLGGDILKLLREEYPQTRRIAVTGLASGGVREILEDYHLDDLLLKGNMTVPAVRKAVRKAIERASDGIPPEVRAEQSRLRADFGPWCAETARRLDEHRRQLTSDIERDRRSAGRLTSQESAVLREKLSQLEAQLTELQTHHETLDRGRIRIDAELASMRTAEDGAAIRAEIDTLRNDMTRRLGADG
jgi:CheY-like chemotaxis protein